MIHYSDPQGSEAWLAARRGVITGSRARDVRGTVAKRMGYAMDTSREREGGTLLATYANAYMREGSAQEPFARRAYEARTGYLVEEVGFVTTDDRKFGASVDGLVDDDGIVEIKTMVSSATLFKAVVEQDIGEYVDQCMFELWLLRRQWCDLILWAPDMAAIGLDMTVIRISRDEAKISALETDLLAFERVVSGLQADLRKAAARNAPTAPIDPTAPWDDASAPAQQPAVRTTAPAALPEDIFA